MDLALPKAELSYESGEQVDFRGKKDFLEHFGLSAGTHFVGWLLLGGFEVLGSQKASLCSPLVFFCFILFRDSVLILLVEVECRSKQFR